MTAPAVGIDLGTTYSCVAVFRNGSVEVIPNELGNRTMPSVVAFTDKGRLVGDAAKDQDFQNPENTIYDAKRLIGRKFDDETVQEDIKNWPFKVINEDGGRPKFRVNHGGETKTFHPEEISAIVLGALKAAATAHLGVEVMQCVVTVPAHFGDAQRQATRDAATIAGLSVLRIINEPTAGALAYGLSGESSDEEKNVLVFDLGGGTFDVSILTIEEGITEVRASHGDTHLGGQDFDMRLCLHLAKEFAKKHPNTNIREDKKAMRRLQTACEKVKRQLSAATESSLQLDNLHANVDFATTVTRACFEKLNEDLFRLTIDLVAKVLHEAELTIKDISEVILVGGSTRIPMVQQLLSQFFDDRELNKSLNPDEAVARGAAVQAAILDGSPEDKTTDLVLIDVAQQSLGIGVLGATVQPLVPRGAVLPTRRTRTFTTAVDRQSSVLIQVFEGERSLAKDNNLLGKFTLRGLPPAPRGTVHIEVTFEVDTDGILQVSAEERSTNKMGHITITNDRNRLSTLQLERLVCEAEANRAKDEEMRETAQTRARLEHYCFSVKARVEDKKNKEKVPGPQRLAVLNKCVDTIKWLDGNATATQNEYKQKLKEVEDTCTPVVKMLTA